MGYTNLFNSKKTTSGTKSSESLRIFAINSGKPPQEAFEMAGNMFALKMQRNNLEI